MPCWEKMRNNNNIRIYIWKLNTCPKASSWAISLLFQVICFHAVSYPSHDRGKHLPGVLPDYSSGRKTNFATTGLISYVKKGTCSKAYNFYDLRKYEGYNGN